LNAISSSTSSPGPDHQARDENDNDLPFSLKALHSAVAVATYGSAARAAAVIAKSATAITRNIQLLETTLGMPLFERHTRGMVPTPAGRVIVARATRAFDQLELGARELREAGGTPDERARDTRPSRLARLVNERLMFVLIAIAETGSASQAGERLRLSQPAVSQFIRDLEHLAGAALVERTSRGMRLTEPGEILLRRIKLTLMELRVAEEEIASIHGVLHGRVTVASLPYSSVDLVPQAVTQSLSLHTQLKVTVIDGIYDSLINELRNAEVDIIVGTLRPTAFDDVEQEPLFEDTLAVVCRAGHPYTRMEHLELRDVMAASWVVPLPSTVTRTSFENVFRADGLEPPPGRLEVHNPMAVRSILVNSDYLALLSVRQVRSELAAGKLAVLPITLKNSQRTIGLTLRRSGSLSPGLKAVRDELRVAARALRRGPDGV
jgi:LysR family transcriptional regulator of gallate degradation